jgi:hypothetical protein
MKLLKNKIKEKIKKGTIISINKDGLIEKYKEKEEIFGIYVGKFLFWNKILINGDIYKIKNINFIPGKTIYYLKNEIKERPKEFPVGVINKIGISISKHKIFLIIQNLGKRMK